MKFFPGYLIIVYLINYGVNGVINKSEDAVLEYTDLLECSEVDFFNTTNFSCERCPLNSIPSESRLECICNKNSRYTKTSNGETICESCEDQSVPTTDSSDCIYCHDNSTCQCLDNEMKIERHNNGTLLDFIKCLPCPDNSYLSIDRSKCLPCTTVLTNNDNNGDSFILHQRIQNFCLRSSLSSLWINDKDSYEIELLHQPVDSYYLRTKLLLTVHLCKNNHKKSCEHLSHICLLTLRMNSIPCQLLNNVTSMENYFYEVGSASMVLSSPKIPSTYSLSNTSLNNKFHFAVATYNLDGKYQSLEEWIPFCSSFNNIRYGVNTVSKCKASARDLFNSEAKFLVPFLSFNDSSNKKKLLYEVPVLIKNINTEVKNVSHWQLSKRFFTIDNISGFKALSNSENSIFAKATQPTAFRYIKSISIQITMQKRENPGKILPPLIVIEYDELSYQQILSDTEISIDYEVIFSFGDKESNLIIEIFIGIFSGLAIIPAAFKTYCYCRKNGYNGWILSAISSFIINYIGIIGNVLLFISIFSSICFFIFYKGQTVLHILLPNAEFEYIIMIITIIAFGGKVVEVLKLLHHHRKLNIFFIDWEQPQHTSFFINNNPPSASLKRTDKNKLLKEKCDLSETISETVERKQRKKTSSKTRQAYDLQVDTKRGSCNCYRKSTQTGLNRLIGKSRYNFIQGRWMVSVWRTYFVANQWLRLKTKRRISIWFQIVGTIFLLEVIGLKNWALAVPDLTLSENNSVKKSFTLQYGVGVIIYVLIYVFQFSLSALYEKYVKNSLQAFVDLCSVANVSLFIFSDDYYGYYIHGRSVHGFSDVDLLSMMNNLKKEEYNLSAHRGLVPGTSEQTFIMCLSREFRSFYNTILTSESSMVKNFRNCTYLSGTRWNERWETNLKLRKFLCEFLDHCFEEIDYIVKEKTLQEKLCNIEFFDTEKTIFYIDDNNNSFDTTIFHGNEWTLATFDLSIFASLLALNFNYIIAAIFTIFLAHVITYIARMSQDQNLAKKSLIDKRFLMS